MEKEPKKNLRRYVNQPFVWSIYDVMSENKWNMDFRETKPYPSGYAGWGKMDIL